MTWVEVSDTKRESSVGNVTLCVEQQGPRWAALVIRNGETMWASDELFDVAEDAQVVAETNGKRISARVVGMPRSRSRS